MLASAFVHGRRVPSVLQSDRTRTVVGLRNLPPTTADHLTLLSPGPRRINSHLLGVLHQARQWTLISPSSRSSSLYVRSLGVCATQCARSPVSELADLAQSRQSCWRGPSISPGGQLTRDNAPNHAAGSAHLGPCHRRCGHCCSPCRMFLQLPPPPWKNP